MLAVLQTGSKPQSFFTQLSQDLGRFRGSTDANFLLRDLRIRTKDREVIPFTPNRVQRAYLDALLPTWETEPTALRGTREILLKARQFGFSTLILALFFLDTITTPNTQTVVVAHDADSTERLFQIVQRFYRLLPEERRPRTQYANRREFLWPDLDSYFFVGTAGAGDFGRGGTINNAHLSEVAFWPDAEDQVAGLLQAVPQDGNVFVETTANGMANWFHDEYKSAERGDSAFQPRFYGWHLHEEYRQPVEAGFQRTAEEAVLAEKNALTDEQLQWRRGKVKELREKFPQEYPLNAHEAFISSGGRVLDEFIPALGPAGHLFPFFVPPKSWRHYLVIDPGWNKLGALFAAVDPEGRVWLYAEHYQGQWRPKKHLEFFHAAWQAFGKPAFDVIMDPAGFDKRRTDTGHEHPSWAAEFEEAAEELGADWFTPRPGDNGDPLALRVKRYLAADRWRVADSCKNWVWEQERWVRQAPKSGRAGAEQRDPEKPIDKYNHLMDPCFIAGTSILTVQGGKPIEQVRAGEMVWTRMGMRRVVAAWETGKRQVYTARFSNGRTLTGTGAHPIWVEGKGWVRLDSLRYLDIIQVWQANPSYSTESPFDVTPTPSGARIASTTRRVCTLGLRGSAGCMRRFGRRLMGLFQMGATFTTGTRTPSTTTPTIWKRSLLGCISPSIIEESAARQNGLTWTGYGLLQPRGIVARKGWSGIAATQRLAFSRVRPWPSPASIAGRFSTPRIPGRIASAPITARRKAAAFREWMTRIGSALTAGLRSALTDTTSEKVAPVVVLGVSVELHERTVYNLQVAETPEYYASGVLVHNCRYLANDLPEAEEVEESWHPPDSSAAHWEEELRELERSTKGEWYG